MWESLSYDPELNLIYFGVGNGLEWNQGYRSEGEGDNWFLSSIVAVNADTGAYVWHYQATPGEEWDYDAVQQLILADLTIDGGGRKVLMQANKNGFFYVIDRQTGKLISAAQLHAGQLGTRHRSEDRPADREPRYPVRQDRQADFAAAGRARRPQLAGHGLQSHYRPRLRSGARNRHDLRDGKGFRSPRRSAGTSAPIPLSRPMSGGT